jgi:ribonuclease BN (tRNA processing enzyme)
VGFANFYHRLTGLYGSSIVEVAYDITVRELSESHLSLGAGQLETRWMQHSPNAIGYRFEADGKALVYSGDTDFGEGIIQLARRADVLLLECSFPDQEKVPGHLTPSEAGKIAKLAEAKKLVLTHFYPSCDQENILAPCARQFQGEIVLAEDLMHLQI